MSRRVMIVFAAAAALFALVLSGCAGLGPQPAEEPQDAVTRLLEARSEGVSDAKVYRLYVMGDEVASALASDSAQRRGEKPTPGWSEPRVFNETTSTADVKVVWERSKEHTGWAEATVFKVILDSGFWVVTDAADVAADFVPKPDAKPGASTTGTPPAGKPATGHP